MTAAVSLIVIATSIWMLVDAGKFGYDKRDIPGLASMSPLGWFFCGLLLWIIAFPLYLAKRGDLKAAGERRRVAVSALAGLSGAAVPNPFDTSPLTDEQVAQGCAILAQQRDAHIITQAACKTQQAQLIARRQS